jgi:hypothetical protein
VLARLATTRIPSFRTYINYFGRTCTSKTVLKRDNHLPVNSDEANSLRKIYVVPLLTEPVGIARLNSAWAVCIVPVIRATGRRAAQKSAARHCRSAHLEGSSRRNLEVWVNDLVCVLGFTVAHSLQPLIERSTTPIPYTYFDYLS